MSRLAKKPITLPAGTSATFADGVLTVKGAKETLSRSFLSDITFTVTPEQIEVSRIRNSKNVHALLGTYAAHVRNMVVGVTEGFKKELVLEGVGYRWSVSGNAIDMQLGFSHPVKVAIPEGISVTIEKDAMTIVGADKEAVGKFAAEIRALKKPEPYKGKGIRYRDETIRRKEGKKAV